jgi:hypothetical protein
VLKFIDLWMKFNIFSAEQSVYVVPDLTLGPSWTTGMRALYNFAMFGVAHPTFDNMSTLFESRDAADADVNTVRGFTSLIEWKMGFPHGRVAGHPTYQTWSGEIREAGLVYHENYDHAGDPTNPDAADGAPYDAEQDDFVNAFVVDAQPTSAHAAAVAPLRAQSMRCRHP